MGADASRVVGLVVVDVQNELSAARHVQDLEATADAEDRHLACEGPRPERKLEGVALLVDRERVGRDRVDLGAEMTGVYIHAAAELLGD